jgi:hypothetical protein
MRLKLANAGILLLLFLMGWAMYNHNQKERVELERVTDYLAEATRESIETRYRKTTGYIFLARNCYDRLRGHHLLPHVNKMERLATVLDSARAMLNHIGETSTATHQAKQTYSAYRQYLIDNRDLFTNTADDVFEGLFNPQLRLDQGLLPETTKTVSSSSRQLSKLVLEDYLVSLTLWESEQMMTHFGGCEH